MANVIFHGVIFKSVIVPKVAIGNATVLSNLRMLSTCIGHSLLMSDDTAFKNSYLMVVRLSSSQRPAA